MNGADDLNRIIEHHRPAAAACLSDLGRRMFFPRGIPAQAEEARSARINATIGQFTDGRGGAMPLPALSRHLVDLPHEAVFLYSSQGGSKALRRAWRDHISMRGDPPITMPFVTVGLTHGLSLVADLFTDPDTDVVIPDPGWGNYGLIFGTRRGARIVRYPVFRDGQFDSEALGAALRKVRSKAVVILNFPGNPTGYTPTEAELAPMLDAISRTDKPLVVVTDDAYAGFVFEPGRLSRSPFFELCTMDPDRVLPIKIDGATKELMYFGARVGFLTMGAEGPAAEALMDKLTGAARATVSTAPAVSQAMVLSALQDPGLKAQQAVLIDTAAERYRTLKSSLVAHGLQAMPFNSGFFALLPVDGDPEALRRSMLADGVGIISLARSQAIRIAYSSATADDLVVLVETLARHIGASGMATRKAAP
jgi:aspartate/methionine/tyrosine aminotransferase